MGRLINRFMLKCEYCKEKSLPLTIEGDYHGGGKAVLYECSLCGYTRHYNKIGFAEAERRKYNYKSKLKRAKKFPYGRLARRLTEAARRYHL